MNKKFEEWKSRASKDVLEQYKEWKSRASKDALEQYNKDIEWFKSNVKCCYNCNHSGEGQDLPFTYKYAFCTKHMNCTTLFDTYCDDYEGSATEQNLIDYLYIDWENQ